MRIVELQEFLALKGNILFREVMALEDGDNTRWAPKEISDPLMVRVGDSMQGAYYESTLASYSLADHILYSCDGNYSSIEKELDLTPTRGDNRNKYFLVYEKADVANIINLLIDTL